MSRRSAWTVDKDDLLRLMWFDAEMTGFVMGRRLGFAPTTISLRAKEIGLPPRVEIEGKGPWQPAEDAILRQIVADGKPASHAAPLLPGRTEHACWSRIAHLRRVETVPDVKVKPVRTRQSPPAAIKSSVPPPALPLPLPPTLIFVPPARTCQYPLWPNGSPPTHRFCDAPVYRHSTCLDHWHRTRVVACEEEVFA